VHKPHLLRDLRMRTDAVHRPSAMKEDTLVVHEIYASIQGESSFAGVPCTFVRLTGCNLRCSWCDTPHAFHGGQRMERGEVVKEVLTRRTRVVEITGGEPLLQPAVLPLMTELCDLGRIVLIETSGERDISQVDPRVRRIMDLKAPGSGESHRNRWENIEHLRETDEVKFVLADRTDYEWARDTIAKYNLADRVSNVLLSVVHGALDSKKVVEWMLADDVPARFQIQMHKVIWAPETKGV
jgi:7-carboxy-7-deazaguanine synthase